MLMTENVDFVLKMIKVGLIISVGTLIGMCILALIVGVINALLMG